MKKIGTIGVCEAEGMESCRESERWVCCNRGGRERVEEKTNKIDESGSKNKNRTVESEERRGKVGI